MSAMFKMFRQSLSATLCVVFAMIILAPAAQAARETTYYHTDGLGSVVAASNQAGELLWRKDYAPFGHQIDQTPDIEKLGYTGKPHDALLGLTNLGARYYDPHLGRFMSPDPVGFVESNPMSFNRYAYVNNNPYKYVDPDGEFLNFAAKFVLDVGVNIAFNYVTTGQMDVGGALKESAIGILNPAKTVAKVGKLASALAKTKKVTKAAGEATQQLRKSDEVIHVTKAGVALPADPMYKIPDQYVQNPYRDGSYGEIVNSKFKERLRIDPATPPSMKGPNYSHYHKEGKGAHYSPANGDKDPGFQPPSNQP
jgi:RHS repeat-associated protein